MTTNDGFFGKVGSIGIGDEYEKRKTGPIGKERKLEPRNFITNPGRKGHGPESFFDRKIKSLAEGDKYVDPGQREKREVLENSKKRITPAGFSYASKHSSKGPISGMLSEYPKHEPEFVVVKPGEVPEKKKSAPKNIMTSPPKKGGPGTWGVTLSTEQYKYVSDPYDASKPPPAKEDKDKKSVGPAFKAAVKGSGGFNCNPNTGTDKIYTLDAPLPASSAQKSAGASTKEKGEKKAAVPWKPSSPPRTGLHATLSGKVPEYQFDPISEVQSHKKDKDDSNKSANVWKPVSSTKSTLSRSIAFVPTSTI